MYVESTKAASLVETQQYQHFHFASESNVNVQGHCQAQRMRADAMHGTRRPPSIVSYIRILGHWHHGFTFYAQKFVY